MDLDPNNPAAAGNQIAQPLVGQIANPFVDALAQAAQAAGVGGNVPAQQIQAAIQNVAAQLRFNQQNIYLPPPAAAGAAQPTVSAEEILAGIANLHAAVHGFGLAQQAANDEARNLANAAHINQANESTRLHTELENIHRSTHENITGSNQHLAEALQAMAAANAKVMEAIAVAQSNLAPAPAPAAPAAASGGSDPTLIAILDKLVESNTMNAARQSTVAATRANCDKLASTLALMEARARNGHYRTCAQRSMQFLSMFVKIVFTDTGELRDDQTELADVTSQWTDPHMLGLQGTLSELRNLSLDTEQDRILARLAFKPFFAKKNHCDDWFKYIESAPSGRDDLRRGPRAGVFFNSIFLLLIYNYTVFMFVLCVLCFLVLLVLFFLFVRCVFYFCYFISLIPNNIVTLIQHSSTWPQPK